MTPVPAEHHKVFPRLAEMMDTEKGQGKPELAAAVIAALRTMGQIKMSKEDSALFDHGLRLICRLLLEDNREKIDHLFKLVDSRSSALTSDVNDFISKRKGS